MDDNYVKFHFSIVYMEVIAPLSKSWLHSTILTAIKETCIVLMKDMSGSTPHSQEVVGGACFLCFLAGHAGQNVVQ